MNTKLIQIVVAVVFGVISWFALTKVTQSVFKNIEERQLSPVRYADRMAGTISMEPRCAAFKAKMLEIGKGAKELNATYIGEIIKVKNSANSVNCAKA